MAAWAQGRGFQTTITERLVYATPADIGRFKVDVLAEHPRARATAERFDVEFLRAAVYEDEGFRAALNCDVLF